MPSDPAKKTQQAAAEALRKRSKKKEKWLTNYNVAVGTVAFCVVGGGYLAWSQPSARSSNKAPSPLESLVNDKNFIYSVTTNAAGNFTAGASPFFDHWKLADLMWGFDGQKTNMQFAGFAGAIQYCDKDESIESGLTPPAYDAHDNWGSCFGEVRNSGNCTAGYAIAAASALSTRFCIADAGKYGGLQLSPQQILSCDKKSKGCNGGGIDSVWSYISRRGLYPESCVPFVGAKGAQCKTTCEDSKKVKPLDYCIMSGAKRLKRDIHNRGPIVAPMRLMDDFLVYKEGVYTPTENAKPVFGQDGNVIEHAITVHGWGKSQGVPYWIIENSWGKSWGENGYARVSMGNIMENYAISITPATEEAIAEKTKLDAEAAVRKEEAKKERAERNARIKEAEEQRAAERAASGADEAELDDLDDVELDDVDADFDSEDEGEKKEAPKEAEKEL